MLGNLITSYQQEHGKKTFEENNLFSVHLATKVKGAGIFLEQIRLIG